MNINDANYLYELKDNFLDLQYNHFRKFKTDLKKIEIEIENLKRKSILLRVEKKHE